MLVLLLLDAISTEICAACFVNSKGHAMNAAIAPAVAPAAPKQTTVPGVGILPGRLTVTNGSSPVTCPIAAEYEYFAFW